MSEPRRSRRAKKNVDYSKEQDFSDGDVFEDSPNEDPTPKRGRPKGSSSRKSTGSRRQQQKDYDDDMMDDLDNDYRSKPIYTEKGYDPNLPPIRDRFPFLPEFEPDGSPRIDLIVGRRAVDEKGDENKASDDELGSPDDNNTDESEPESRGRRGSRRGEKRSDKSSPSAKDEGSGVVEYEYLVKYKNRSYLHLEWKTGADLESMNKSAKTLYRRYLKKLAQGNDDELENPEFDPSYAVPQKIVAEKIQELTLELSDKELLKWEKEREKELAEESDDDDEEEGEKKKDGGSKENLVAIQENPEKKEDQEKGKPNYIISARNYCLVLTD